jgi:hypothetical protein
MNLFTSKGGVVEAVVKDATSPCIFGEILPQGEFVIHGSCRKIDVVNYVNNLALYPCPEIT